VKKSCR